LVAAVSSAAQPVPFASNIFREGVSPMADFALQVENLVKVYHPRRGAAVRAVDGMSFGVGRGQIFGLLGPNGAGKTTILKVLTTLIQPTSGRAEMMGFDVVARPLEVRRRISVVLQESAVEMFLSVRDNLLTFARFHGLPGDVARRRAAEVMERFNLTEEADRKVQDLSGGFRRRVQVSKMFMVETPVMFLDEFSTGMDPILKRAVMGYLREEAARGRTIVLTTQVLSEAEELCDDILIMNKGRQVARGDLYALKLLSQGVYEVAMTFEQLPASIEAELERLQPLRMSINQNTVELALKADEARVLELVSELAKKGRVLRVEVSGASLEDIFVELTQEV
ncbi:MAG TPA: ABC transporter ATP-binding protein, partial [Candidatus Acidoferrales bacterium]|nr:ABC transporter ATP-binding protein [Candidatus Acidoferrales bacterium]